MKTLLLGMGNPILSDDAVGVRLATEFKAVFEARPQLDIVEECSVGGINLLELFRGYQRAIVLDSVQPSGGVPGTWRRFTAVALRETVHLTNIHDANFATALELGRRLGMPLPEDEHIHVLAVEIQDNLTFSERMTPALERAFPALKAAIFRELFRILQGASRQSDRRQNRLASLLDDCRPTVASGRPRHAQAGAARLPLLSQQATTLFERDYG